MELASGSMEWEIPVNSEELIDSENSSIRNVLLSFTKFEIKEMNPYFDRKIVMRHPSLIDLLEEEDELMNHMEGYLEIFGDPEPRDENYKKLAESGYFGPETDFDEKMAIAEKRTFEIYEELKLNYENAIRVLASENQVEPEELVNIQDYGYKIITTAFPDRDHLQKLWDEIYSIGIDIVLSSIKEEEELMKDEINLKEILSNNPTEEGLFELKDQFIGARMKMYDIVYATQIQNPTSG